MELLSQQTAFEGRYMRYKHASSVTGCEMVFSVFVPPQALQGEEQLGSAPVVYWLSGLTCTDENFMQKAGAQRIASDLGLILVCPDTSPRGDHIPDDPEENYDLGIGAGFYVNATEPPWDQHYRMYDYVVFELPELLRNELGIKGLSSVMGHSMGGHGALTIGLRHPELYRSISAFSPIANPSLSPWGQKAFRHYLGAEERAWQEHDAVILLEKTGSHLPILVDQGSDDQFLEEQLGYEELETALRQNKGEWTLNLRDSYDHSYFFIASFIEDHLRFHHQHLTR